MTMSKYKEFVGLLLVVFFILFFGYLFFFENAHPFIVLGVGTLLIVWSLIVIGISIVGIRQPWNYGIGAIGGILAACFVILTTVVFSREPLYYLQYRSMFTAFEPACNGKAYPENPAFQENTFNPLFAIDPPAKAGKWSANPIKLGWVSENPNEISLVACFYEQDILEQTCNYTGATVKRYRNQVTVRLVEAKTGTLIEQQVFMGTEPNDCPTSVSGSGEISGKMVEWDSIGDWLGGFVHPPK